MFKSVIKKIFGIKENENISTKYKNSGLNKELALELNQKLLDLMIKNKLYRDTDLNLEKLSKSLETNRHNTSQIINQYHRKSYSDFINDFRIDDAKEILMKQKNLNINKLIYDLGFNTKSNFYEAFKKRTNLTPSQFKEKYSHNNFNTKGLI